MMFRLLALLLAATGLHAQESGITEWDVPPYRVVLKTNLEDGHRDDLTVFSEGKAIYHLADEFVRSELTFGRETMADDLGKPTAGHDLQQDPGHDVLAIGRSNLVFAEYSGGPHCCFKAIILLLDKTFRAQTIDLFDAGGYFHSVDGRTDQVLEATDATFKEWRSAATDSPFPTIILSFDRAAGRYVADADLMRAPLPAPDELDRKKDLARQALETFQKDGRFDEEPLYLTSPMLDLIYSGHMTEAHDFLAQVWLGDSARREAYWSRVTRCKLRSSEYWPVVAKLNGLKPELPDCGPSVR